MSSPTVVSLFSGCGGLDWGFEQAGFEIKFACDNDPLCVEVYNRNLSPVAECFDVTSREFANKIQGLKNPDVVLGGFPCQGFSKAGPKHESDVRNQLFWRMHDVVRILQPKVFVAENVDGLAQNYEGNYLKSVVNAFSELGYHVQVKMLDAIQFGVPQFRRRLFFVGTLEPESFKFPAPTHQSETRNGEFRWSDHPSLWENMNVHMQAARSIAEALGDLPEDEYTDLDHVLASKPSDQDVQIMRQVKPGQKLCNVRHAPTSVYTWDIPSVFGEVSSTQRRILETIATNRRHRKYGSIPNGNPLSIEVISQLMDEKVAEADCEDLVLKGYLKAKLGGYDLRGATFASGMYKRPRWEDASPTVLTNFHLARYFVHPRFDRPFTVREVARLQGFPDSFRFEGRRSRVRVIGHYRQIGNAVAPPVARVLGEAVMASLTCGGRVEATA